MNYWWVNQNKTYKSEVGGGFLWSPKKRANGGRNHFYENMQKVEQGDVVFSFCDTRIKAIGVASACAVSAVKPDFGNAGEAWSNEGWLVQVEFKEIAKPIRPKDHMDVLAQHLPSKYSPLQCNGKGMQSLYLAGIEPPFADALIGLIGSEYDTILNSLCGRITADDDALATKQEKELLERTDIGPTQKLQLVKARRGQGVFRANVRLHEKKCRLTQVADPEHLRASHIKPWKDSSDIEKIDGSNGLMLAPHIDHLFDRGFISFADNGDLLVATVLSEAVGGAWAIVAGTNGGAFTEKQRAYLDHHRRKVFKGSVDSLTSGLIGWS